MRDPRTPIGGDGIVANRARRGRPIASGSVQVQVGALNDGEEPFGTLKLARIVKGACAGKPIAVALQSGRTTLLLLVFVSQRRKLR